MAASCCCGAATFDCHGCATPGQVGVRTRFYEAPYTMASGDFVVARANPSLPAYGFYTSQWDEISEVIPLPGGYTMAVALACVQSAATPTYNVGVTVLTPGGTVFFTLAYLSVPLVSCSPFYTAVGFFPVVVNSSFYTSGDLWLTG